ncbi:type II toxin-antitoxin system RelE/ParE family toxin [Aquibacillus salsiterrae]|uniref:Type II toxin-antitoxin system RelE/ParE family toxin n=1 Tax=Aquibacillus salsiterrae TaxID=2950439 RepID=A0A9X3WIQ7_9BACI|nr:type II toxin-antitoxin system RelE/ParE family toxin [Aquibacillus salsiterrae]MDC3418184.1 type II toxin-antitoxin system RelE/ParE family toxin [Aquibacillus salsiterrae]
MEKADKRYTVIISDKATEMLVSHTRFLTNVSNEGAEKLIEDFTVSAKSLESIPERNPLLSDPSIPSNRYRKLLFGKRYLMVYQIKNSHVYVDYIVDCRQDYQWLL